MSNESFPEKIDFKKLEDDFKRLHANQKLEEELTETSQEGTQAQIEEKSEEKLQETIETYDTLIVLLQKALDAKEIPDWTQAEDVLVHFQDKRQKALEEQERLHEQERLSQKYSAKSENEIETFEKLQKEQADARNIVSLAALKNLLQEEITRSDFKKGTSSEETLKNVEKRLEALRNNKKSL